MGKAGIAGKQDGLNSGAAAKCENEEEDKEETLAAEPQRTQRKQGGAYLEEVIRR